MEGGEFVKDWGGDCGGGGGKGGGGGGRTGVCVDAALWWEEGDEALDEIRIVLEERGHALHDVLRERSEVIEHRGSGRNMAVRGSGKRRGTAGHGILRVFEWG